MAENAQPPVRVDWIDRSGLPHLLRVLGLAVHPPKLGIALAAIILTFVLGSVLDWLWTINGGVDAAAIRQFVAARASDLPYQEPAGDHGIFEVWRTHERNALLGLLGSSIPFSSWVTGTSGIPIVEPYAGAGPLPYLSSMGYGVWWMLRHHLIYFIVFIIGLLLIWGWCGGAICRLAAVHFAVEEKLTLAQGLRFGRKHLLDGFVLAPCIPVVFIIIIMVLLALAGVFLRIPVLGDLVGGATFVLPLFGGIVITLLLAGLVIGGHLFWPAVAVEGQDAYDSFSRALSYAFSRPWKTVLYSVIAVAYGAICWLVVRWFTFLALAVTRGGVAWGTSPFGWWAKGGEATPTSKLDLLWPTFGPTTFFAWPDSSGIAWHEYIAVFFIAVYVMLLAGLMWAFLASFYFSGTTVIYFLLRRDVDNIDLEDVHLEVDAESEDGASTSSMPDVGNGSTIPVPVTKPEASPAQGEFHTNEAGPEPAADETTAEDRWSAPDTSTAKGPNESDESAPASDEDRFGRDS